MKSALNIQLEPTNCPLCGWNDSNLWAEENGYTAVKCRPCGLVYVNPRPQLQTISEAAKTGVHKTDDGELTVTFRRSEKKIHRYRRIIQEMFAGEIARGVPLSWLDIGAGYGEFIEAVLSAMPAGGKVCGVEPMQAKVRSAMARGLPIVDEALSRVDGHYDVISLINVFSHIPDFSSFLRDIAEKINPQGILFLETGNGGDIERNAYPDSLHLPDHLVFAGVKDVEKFLQNAGFRVEMVRERRVDTAAAVVKRSVQGLLRGRVEAALPYRSAFRTVFFKARRA